MIEVQESSMSIREICQLNQPRVDCVTFTHKGYLFAMFGRGLVDNCQFIQDLSNYEYAKIDDLINH